MINIYCRRQPELTVVFSVQSTNTQIVHFHFPLCIYSIKSTDMQYVSDRFLCFSKMHIYRFTTYNIFIYPVPFLVIQLQYPTFTHRLTSNILEICGFGFFFFSLLLNIVFDSCLLNITLRMNINVYEVFMHRRASCVCCKFSHFNDFSSQAKNHRRANIIEKEKRLPTNRTESELSWARLNFKKKAKTSTKFVFKMNCIAIIMDLLLILPFGCSICCIW